MPAEQPSTSAIAQRQRLFAGPGEMRERCRAHDWEASALGPVERWPQSLRGAVTTALGSAFPSIVLWGPELIQVYNDAYREIMGAKHPMGFAIPTRECWPEAWEFNAPIYRRVFAGETVFFEDVLIPIARHGKLEDVYFTISYGPVLGEAGEVAGVLVTLLETTGRVTARRLEVERERLLSQLQVERNRLGAVFRQAPAFLAVVRGAQHVFELANDSYLQLVGHREIIGKPVSEALPEVADQGFIDLLDRVLATGEPVHGREMPIVLTRTPGAEPEERFVDFVYQPLVEADGSRSGVVAHGSDVTVQVRARREVERLLAESERSRAALDEANRRIRASEERLRDVFEQAPMAVAVLTGPDHVYTVASPGYTRYLGGRPLLGRAFREAVPEAAGQEVAALMDRVYATGEPVQVKERVVALDRDGDGVPEEYVFDISYQPLRDASGQVYAITSLSLDVTEQVRARRLSEEATRVIAEARLQLERVFSQSPVPIAVLEGPAHRYTLANAQYERLTGRTALLGRTVREVFAELEGTGVFELFDQVLESGEPLTASEFAVSFRRRPGAQLEEGVFNFTFQPLRSAAGTVYAIAVVAVEVTEQVRARQVVERLLHESEQARAELEAVNAQLEQQQVELELANQHLQDNAAELEAQTSELQAQTEELELQTAAAEMANRAKSDFLATMSHELRTPLNAIGGYADLLLAGVRGELTDAQRDDVERMKRSGQHLLGLINSILNFAKLDSGEVEFQLQPVPAAALLDGLQDLVGPQMAARSLRFEVGLFDRTIEVLADAEKARQILLNLLTNAVKFTDPEGTIALACDADDRWARIHVRDTGRGIAAAQLPRIFDPFVQVDRHLTPASQQGVGLGLSISRDLAIGMGGELTVVSAPGRGSTFTLKLRRA